MKAYPLDPSEYLTTITRETNRLADIADNTEILGPIVSCPEWTIENLLYHVGRVQRRVSWRVSGDAQEATIPPEPPRSELTTWLRDSGDMLVEALKVVGPAQRCATLDGEGVSAFWYRRMAHEIVIHCIDGDLAAGTTPAKLDPFFAGDGLDEIVRLHLPRWAASSAADHVYGNFEFVASDAETTWPIELGRDEANERDHLPTRVTAPANSLLLFFWNRGDAVDFVVEGNDDLIRRWRDVVHM